MLFFMTLHNPSWKQIYRFTPIHPLLFLNCSAPPMQSVPITTKVVSLNPDHGEEYSIQHYVIKVVSGLRWVGGFLRVLLFPPQWYITEILLKVALNTINQKPNLIRYLIYTLLIVFIRYLIICVRYKNKPV